MLKKLIVNIQNSGITPVVVFITIILLIAIQTLGLFGGVWKDFSTVAFQPLALVLLVEILLIIFSVKDSVEEIALSSKGDGASFTLIAPPQTTGINLIHALDATKVGYLKIICYGTNKYGQALDYIVREHMNIKTSIVLCDSECALHENDTKDIADVVSDLEIHENITIYKASVLPTIRAALLYDKRMNPVWASVSTYLIHKKRRGLKSEGLCPVIMSDQHGSTTMKILSKFIETEFDRLKQTSKSPLPPSAK